MNGSRLSCLISCHLKYIKITLFKYKNLMEKSKLSEFKKIVLQDENDRLYLKYMKQ
jgi:hypothetical protein